MTLGTLLSRLAKIQKVISSNGQEEPLLSINHGKLVISRPSMLSDEDRDAIIAMESVLTALVSAWGNRRGTPRLPDDFSLTIVLVKRWPYPIANAWKARKDDICKLGIEELLAGWTAYLQMIDVMIEVDLKNRESFIPALRRLSELDYEIKESVYYDPKLMDLKRERSELRTWIDANVPDSL